MSASLMAGASPASPKEANLHRPLDIPLVLSGNFGELRNNHFHSGLDFKTQGRTGFKVMAAADGYVSRVLVSPWGFGRAVYVTHPSLGLTTVYGHLEGFNRRIADEVAKRQNADRSFRVDFALTPGAIPVKRGEVIAYSGNAGASGGPHLHMDVRDAVTEEALDPMPYFKAMINDKVPPEVRSVSVVPTHGVVDGASKVATRTPANLSIPFKAWGRVVPAIKAYDRMNGTSNIYGVKYLTLKVDGKEVYKRVIDRFDFDDTRAVHTLIDYPSKVNSGQWIMVTSVPPSKPLGAMVKGDGSIDINSEREYKCEFILEDAHGNRTSKRFTIVGQKAPIPDVTAKGTAVSWHKGGNLSNSGITVSIPPKALYDDACVDIRSNKLDGYRSAVYSIGVPSVPLHKGIDVSIDVTDDTHPAKTQYLVVRLDGTRKIAVGGSYDNGKMRFSTNRFGRYAVTTDTQAPTIIPVRQAKWRKTNRLRFKIGDNLSGIQKFDGYIDGQWVVMELDGKSGTLSYSIDRKRFPATARHTAKIQVTDACGNTATKEFTF